MIGIYTILIPINKQISHASILYLLLYIGDHNYDYPPNAIGTVLGPNTQECYKESSVIDIVSVLTAHHKGHFEVSLYDCNMYYAVHVRIFFYVSHSMLIYPLLPVFILLGQGMSYSTRRSCNTSLFRFKST